jgi:hypothetical protein
MKRRGITLLTTGLLLAAVSILPALAQEKVDEKLSADPEGTVTIENVSGSVEVVGWDRDEVHVTGTLGRGTEKLEFERDGRRIRVKVKIPRRARDVDPTDLVIKLPAGSEVEVSTVSADIDVRKVDGKLYLHSVSGDVVASGKAKEFEAETVSGQIEATVTASRVSASSVSGDVVLEEVEGEIQTETVSGDVRVEGGRFSRLRASSVSGELSFSGSLEGDADVTLESHSGDVDLLLDGDVDADFEITAFSGDIETDFGEKARRTSKYGPGKELEFQVGSGSARVRIEVFSGDVTVRKR